MVPYTVRFGHRFAVLVKRRDDFVPSVTGTSKIPGVQAGTHIRLKDKFEKRKNNGN
jgi:hypothetical protein